MRSEGPPGGSPGRKAGERSPTPISAIGRTDHPHRHRAVEETSTSFVVEASAGTGKTRTLIDRIQYLVLEKGPAGPPLSLSEICAITFTEKAASEMKVRLRQDFEQILTEGNASGDRQERALKALGDLETAAISTIHSFAVSMLKEKPIDADLDPRFKAMDELRSEIFFRKVWEPWIHSMLADRHPTLEKALRNGFRLEKIQEIAQILCLHWIAVRNLPCDAPPSEEEYEARIKDLLREGESHIRQVIKPEDKLVGRLEEALFWLKDPHNGDRGVSKPGSAGSAKNWDGGKDMVREVQEYVRSVAEFRTEFMNQPVQRLLSEVAGWIKEDFVRKEWERLKQAGGWVGFDDQLWKARDLLLKRRDARREFQERYKVLLVDEFQDTDPLQWDIVLLLSSNDFEETDLSKLRPAPGKLFIVGDPKQSIYRFRNADIETYIEIVDEKRRQSLGLDLLELTTNFRSVPSILRFVDAAFEEAMKPAAPAANAGRYQPHYLAFGNHGYRKTELSPPAVSILGDKGDDDSRRTAREFVKIESNRIAGLIQRIHGSEAWKIWEHSGEGESVWRAPRYGDIAILLPVLTHASLLEEALKDREIPYVLEGGKFYYARSEVSSAITVLKAIANPNDRVALYGALRSIFFGLSDEDLLRTHIQGTPLDYREPVPPETALFHPFEILGKLHRHRHERLASETFEMLLQQTGAREVLAVHGLQSLANLNKLGRTLRALQMETTFTQVVDLLGMMDEEGLAESESRLMEERSDAVRIMTIHKAKGLDFPIVIAAALGTKKVARGKSLLADPHTKRRFALNIGSRDSGLQTPAYGEMAEEEKKREDAELVRLLYVALTRARDHLILSTHTAGRKKADSSEQWLPDTEGTRLKSLGPFLTECLSGESDLVRVIDVEGLDVERGPAKAARSGAGKNWRDIAEGEYRSLHSLVEHTPSARSLQAAGQAADGRSQEDSPREERLPEAAPSRAARLGMAFHEAMERVDLFQRGNWLQCLGTLDMNYKLDRESARDLREMVRLSLSSDLLQRACEAVRSGGRLLRELPFVRPLNPGTVEEGKIDLLFEEANGWILVDYKTDWVAKKTEEMEEFFRNKYSPQIREYVDALGFLSIKVVSAYLLLARTGKALQII